jgi:uridine phosphorylase
MGNCDGVQHHIKLQHGDVGRYVLLPGDPARSERIAAYFDNKQFLGQNREYTSFSGTLYDEKVSVVSTGIGGPSTAIAVEELIAIGADTFIRVGTSGAMQPWIKTGDIAIVTAAIRDEGSSLHYMPIEFPAVADIDVVMALCKGARQINIPYYMGISHSKDSFYGEISPERMPVARRLQDNWKAWVTGGAICSEMETAAIFIICAIHGKRAGGVMLMASGNDDAPNNINEKKELDKIFDIDRAIRTAVEGLKILIKQDRGNQ